MPVLVDGDEVVSDSKRIIQYLEWRYGSGDEKPKEKAGGKPAAKKRRRSPRRNASGGLRDCGPAGAGRAKKRAEDEAAELAYTI